MKRIDLINLAVSVAAFSGIANLAAAQQAFFDSHMDRIEVEGVTNLSSAATYEAIIMFPSGLGADGMIFGEHTSFVADKQLSAGPTYIWAYSYPVSPCCASVPATISFDAWHHIAYCYDGAQERFYLDGILVDAHPASGAIHNGLDVAEIGAQPREGSIINLGFIGYIDSVRISSVARYSGASFTPAVGDFANDADTQLLYNFNETPGSTTVIDSSGHNLNGILGPPSSGFSAPIFGSFPTCDFDISPPGGDNLVNVGDLLAVINSWGPCKGCAADLAPAPSGDDNVNVADLLAIINSWGSCP